MSEEYIIKKDFPVKDAFDVCYDSAMYTRILEMLIFEADVIVNPYIIVLSKEKDKLSNIFLEWILDEQPEMVETLIQYGYIEKTTKSL